MADHMEEWRQVPGYPTYWASSHGRVMSRVKYKRPRVLVGGMNGKGYRLVGLYRDGQRRMVAVHSVIALTFLGPRPDGLDILHRDGDSLNNAAVNLRYGTQSENELDKVRHGVHHEARKTHCPQRHPYDAANTYVYPKTGKRACRTCMRTRRRDRKIRHMQRAAGLAA